MKLNQDQQRAVDHEGAHLLIVAGPGTGKTQTLTHRIARKVPLLKSNQRILAITFTQKASTEMSERLRKKLSVDERHVFVSTFHGFCLSFLKRFYQLAQLPQDFKLITPEETEEVLKKYWLDIKTNERRKHLEEIYRNKSLGLADSPIVKSYNQILRAHQCLDYDDLLIETVHLLVNDSSIRFQIQKEFPLIFVDEYQDINALQHRLLKLLVGEGVEITAIGDPHQAIYGFRGAQVNFFEQFKNDFPPMTQLNLTTNYRSSPNLLEASSQIIQKGKFPLSKLTAHIYEQGKLVIYESPTEKSEAEYIVTQIERMVGGLSMFSHDSHRVDRQAKADRSFGDIAVLYRLNAQRKYIEEALLRSGIPYAVSGEKHLESEEFLNIRSEKVNLLTMHAAKGLEFPVVFIIGCEEHLVPLDIEGLETDREEERRLFYVAMTRAKEELYLTRSKKRILFGRMMQNQVSLFIRDIEEDLKTIDAVKIKRRLKEKAVQLDLKF